MIITSLTRGSVDVCLLRLDNKLEKALLTPGYLQHIRHPDRGVDTSAAGGYSSVWGSGFAVTVNPTMPILRINVGASGSGTRVNVPDANGRSLKTTTDG
jgi:hypothetical protein